MTTPHLKKSIGRSPLRLGFLLIPLALAWFALPPIAQAQLPGPSPDGGYPTGNTAEGDLALQNNTTGTQNTADGAGALLVNTTGNNNTANGARALNSNATGNNNTANGFQALGAFFVTGLENTGSNNTATGAQALLANTTGNNNTASGFNALRKNTTGVANTANGTKALFSNTTGTQNTATGIDSLSSNKTGSGNTADGDGALGSNTGSFNTAIGFDAGTNLTTGSNNIDIGNIGVAGESNTMRIGTKVLTATYILGINGATVPGGVGVIIGSNGQLGTVQSSARFKDDIKPMDKASEAILALQPVTFRYKHELDPDGIPQFGLVAEEVEKVNPDLVARDDKGKPYTVRYEAVNAMLLNEFLKEHSQVQQLKATVAQQQEEFRAKIAQQQKQIEALTATVQKVSDQVLLSKPVPQLVANH